MEGFVALANATNGCWSLDHPRYMLVSVFKLTEFERMDKIRAAWRALHDFGLLNMGVIDELHL